MNETDRELLELAAKAVGHVVARDACELMAGVDGVMLSGVQKPWSPLTDDGDAMRLAVKMRMQLVLSGDNLIQAIEYQSGAYGDEKRGADPYAATRRAIVRAAAEIGRGMS